MSEAELVKRLERLERNNRWMTGAALAALGVAALALVGTIPRISSSIASHGQSASNAPMPIPNAIRAHEFDVVDSSGSIRGILGIDQSRTSELRLLDANGRDHVAITANPFSGAAISLTNERGPVVMMDVSATDASKGAFGPGIWLFNSKDHLAASIRADRSDEPSIRLFGPDGFEMDLGSASTITPSTGAAEQTSAASIVLFGSDKKHHVIWRAP
jgi:hypothetical protein